MKPLASPFKIASNTDGQTNRSNGMNHRKSNSVSFAVNDFVGKIGWGILNQNVSKPPERVVLKN